MTSSRRKFLKTSAAATAATIVPRHVLGGPGFTAPSDRVNVALIGAGGRGFQNANELMKLEGVTITDIVDPADTGTSKTSTTKESQGGFPLPMPSTNITPTTNGNTNADTIWTIANFLTAMAPKMWTRSYVRRPIIFTP